MTINTNIKISPGNSKMGAIPSVSLPAIKTCRDCKCKEKCYAAKRRHSEQGLSAPHDRYRRAQSALRNPVLHQAI